MPFLKRNKDGGYSTFIVLALIAILYFTFNNQRYFVDGISDANLINNSTTIFIHPNHPLWPLFPQILFKIGFPFFTSYPSLYLVQIVSIMGGVFTLATFLYLLHSVNLKPVTVIACALLFSFSSGVWFFSTTPNQYSTALFLSTLVLVFLSQFELNLRKKTDWGLILKASIIAGIGVLFHQINIFLIFPLAHSFSKKSPSSDRKSRLVSFAGGSAVMLAVVFFGMVLAALFSGNLNSISDFISWQKSYVVHPQYWANDFIDSISRTFRGIIETHISHGFHPEGLFGDWSAGSGSILIRICQVAVLIFFFYITIHALYDYLTNKIHRNYQTLGLSLVFPLLIFSFFFTPESPNYRIFYLPAYFLFIAPWIENTFALDTFSFRRAAPLFLVIAMLFTSNFLIRFLPESNPGNNPYISEALRLGAFVSGGDLVIVSSSSDDYIRSVYIPYFTGAETSMIHEVYLRSLEDRYKLFSSFDEIYSSGGKILIHEDAVHFEEDADWVKKFYGVDINPDDLDKLLFTNTSPGEDYLINGKLYIELIPSLH
ncbi:MAG TPA: DUF2723 domain-containing protein [bacterium]